MDKLYPSILFVVEFIEDMPVEDKDSHYWLALFQCFVKGGIVVHAKVAAEPEDIDSRFQGCVCEYNVLRGSKFGRKCDFYQLICNEPINTCYDAAY